MEKKSGVTEFSQTDWVVMDWLKELRKAPSTRVTDEREQPGISPLERLKGILKKCVVVKR